MSLLQAARSGDLAGLQAALRTGAKLEETNFDSCVRAGASTLVLD